MKNHFVSITTLDDKVYLVPMKKDLSIIGKPLNHPEHIGHAVNIARSGFCIDNDAKEPIIVPPSQIKSVQLIER